MGKTKKRNPELVAFGKRLADARGRRGWNQTALAFHAGCAQSDVSQYETGAVEPGVLRLLAFCREIGCSADYLLGLDERRLPK